MMRTDQTYDVVLYPPAGPRRPVLLDVSISEVSQFTFENSPTPPEIGFYRVEARTPVSCAACGMSRRAVLLDALVLGVEPACCQTEMV